MYHVKRAVEKGVSKDMARKVSQLLDLQKPHKLLHTVEGVALMGALFGRDGVVASSQHMLDDWISETMKKELKRLAKAV